MRTLATLTSALLAGAMLATPASAHPRWERTCRSGCVTAFALPDATSGAEPFGVTRGPLLSEWFSLDHGVGRIDPRGHVITYTAPTPNPLVGWMTSTPDGGVWFAERFGGKLGRISASGRLTEYDLPTGTAAVPQGIVVAPDGNVYVSEQGANAIARLNPRTGHATDIPVPTPDSGPQGGVLGPDGAVWFVERSADKVGRMTLAGHFTEYPLTPGSFPNRIVAGPDGALWFTELDSGRLGRITIHGTLTEYPIEGGPVGIVVGRDGQLYVDLYTSPGVARVNTRGRVTGRWALPGAGGPLQIATGLGLDLWITDMVSGRLYRVTPYRP